MLRLDPEAGDDSDRRDRDQKWLEAECVDSRQLLGQATEELVPLLNLHLQLGILLGLHGIRRALLEVLPEILEGLPASGVRFNIFNLES